MAVFLVICAVVSFVAFAYRVDAAGHRTPFLQSLTSKPYHILSVAVLIVVIPVVVYYALKLWLAGDVSPFEDIDKAWQAGIAALEQNGLDMTQVPIFLIVGSSGELQEKALFAASRLSLNVREVPQGPAALHWYANPDAIYIAATNTSGMSRLAAWPGRRPRTRNRGPPDSLRGRRRGPRSAGRSWPAARSPTRARSRRPGPSPAAPSPRRRPAWTSAARWWPRCGGRTASAARRTKAPPRRNTP